MAANPALLRMLAVAISLLCYCSHADKKGPGDDWLDPGVHWFDPSPSPAPSSENVQVQDGKSMSSQSERCETDDCQYKKTENEDKLTGHGMGGAARCVGEATTGMPHFRRFVSVLLNMLDQKGITAGTEFLIHSYLDETRLELLRNFSHDQDVGIQEVNLVLEKMITDMSRMDGQYIPPTLVFGLDVRTLQTIAMSVLVVLLSIWLLVKIVHLPPVSYSKLFLAFLFVVLVISTVMEWFHLYEKAIAQKLSTLVKDIPSECTSEGMTGLVALGVWMRNAFTFSDDPCLKYHQAAIVNPIVMASPMQALASSFTQVIVQPMKMIAGGFGEAFKVLMQPVPIQWQPLVFIAALIFGVLMLTMMMGYGFNIPLLFSFGPRERPLALPTSKDMPGMLLKIQESMDQQNAQTEDLRQQNLALHQEIRDLRVARPPLAIALPELLPDEQNIPTSVEETHPDKATVNNFNGQPNIIDSIGASVSGQ